MSTHKLKYKKSKGNLSTLDRALVGSAWSLLATLVISAVLLLISTALTMLYSDPTSLADVVGYVCLYASAFLGGFAASKIEKGVPYLTSIFCGLFFVLLSMLTSIAVPHTLSSGMNVITRISLHALSLALFPIGAFAGVKGAKANRPKKKKRR